MFYAFRLAFRGSWLGGLALTSAYYSFRFSANDHLVDFYILFIPLSIISYPASTSRYEDIYKFEINHFCRTNAIQLLRI